MGFDHIKGILPPKGGSPLFHSLARSLHEVSECSLYHAQRERSIFRFEVQVYPLNVYK